jgi:thiol-disulfide isomerase/thioredoxin
MTTTSKRPLGLAILLAASLSGLAVSFVRDAHAQQPVQSSPVSPSFRQIGLYSLEIDGKPAPDAAFFHSQATGSIVIRTSMLPTLVELQPRGRILETYAPDAYHRNTNGTIDRLPRAKAILTSTFELVDSLPQFELDGRKVVVKDKAPLLGPQTAQDLVEHDPTYGLRGKLYQPTPEYIDALRQFPEPVTVRVFFGNWCSVCSELMPNVLRVEEELAGSKIRFEYYGIPRSFDDAEAQRLQVKQLPTGIVFVGGQEVRRIVGHSWRFPDMSLRNALGQAARPAGP